MNVFWQVSYIMFVVILLWVLSFSLHKIISTWTTLFCFYFHAGFSVNLSVDCRILLNVKLFCFVTIYPEAAKIKSKYNDIEWLSEEMLKVAPMSHSQNENSNLSRYKDSFNFQLYTWFHLAFISIMFVLRKNTKLGNC